MVINEMMQGFLKELGKIIEYERFVSGMGKYEFAKKLGIHYHTYSSFIKQDRITHPKTGKIIIDYLLDSGRKDIVLKLYQCYGIEKYVTQID